MILFLQGRAESGVTAWSVGSGMCIRDRYLGNETWSLDAKGRRVLVKKKGCLFGALGAEDPRTGKRHGNGTCLGGLLVRVTDLSLKHI